VPTSYKQDKKLSGSTVGSIFSRIWGHTGAGLMGILGLAIIYVSDDRQSGDHDEFMMVEVYYCEMMLQCHTYVLAKPLNLFLSVVFFCFAWHLICVG
jgi:hypothetical protein